MFSFKPFLVFVILQSCFLKEVVGFSFELIKTTDWQYPGRCLDFTLKATLTSTSPLSLKVHAPHVNSAPHMVILGSTFRKESKCTSYTGSYKPVLTARSSNAQLKDDLNIDLGTVTISGTCVMYFDIKFQLINHADFANGQVVWPGFAVEYLNNDVFAIQHAVKTMSTNAPQPSLTVKLEPAQDVFDASQTMDVKVKVAHDCSRTTAKAVSSEVTIVPPQGFQYSAFTASSGSVAVTKKVVSDLVFEAGQLDFHQQMEFNVQFTLSSSGAKQGRDLERAVFYADVTAQGSSSCASEVQDYPSSDAVTTSCKIYKPFGSCDSEPGSGSTDIVYQSFNASSYSAQAEPDQARFTNPGAWKPSTSLKTDSGQYIQVSFTTMVKLRRFAIQGLCDTIGNDTDRFAKTVKVYYSTNGAIWKPVKEGSNVKVFQANTKCKGTAIVPLPYDIEAKYVRINPVDFENAIAIKVEFYGCRSTTSVQVPPIVIPNRSIIPYLENIIVCNTGMNKKTGESSCYFSSDGQTWKALHFLVRHVSFHDIGSGKLYGLGGQDGTIAFRSPTNIDEPWEVIPLAEFTNKRAASTIDNQAKSADSLVINDDPASITPAAGDTFDLTGKSWGFSGKGVHLSTDNKVTWTMKAVWMCTGSCLQ